MAARSQSSSTHRTSSDHTVDSTQSVDQQGAGSEAWRASISLSPGRRRGRGLAGTRADRVPPALEYDESRVTLLLRPAEVAATLGISRSKVFELLAAHELPSVHIGRSTRVPRLELEDWIHAQVRWQPRASSGLLRRLQNGRTPGSR
jgi:excisionase family DNA binding protein